MFAYSCFSSVCTGMNVSVLMFVLSAVLANKRVHNYQCINYFNKWIIS